MFNKKEDLQATINCIKRIARFNGTTVSDEEIAIQALMSNGLLQMYLTGEKEVPDVLVPKLLTLYGIEIRTVEDRIPFYVDISDDDDDEEEEVENSDK